MTYNPPACRILVTDQDRSSHLSAYNPEGGDGPWVYKKDVDHHSWNGNFCIEIMLECPISLTDVTGIRYVNHNPNQCCIDYRTCSEQKLRKERAAALFLTELISRRIPLPTHLFTEGDDEDRHPNLFAHKAWSEVFRALVRAPLGNETIATDATDAVARSILGCFADQQMEDLMALTSLFASEHELVQHAANLFNEALDVPEANGFKAE